MDKETEAQTVTPNPSKQLPSGGSNCKPTMASCSDCKAYMLPTDGDVSMIWVFKRGRDHIQVRFFLNFIFSKYNFKRSVIFKKIKSLLPPMQSSSQLSEATTFNSFGCFGGGIYFHILKYLHLV